MASSAPPNPMNGAGYALRANPFEVLCLNPTDDELTLRAVRVHKRVVVKHVRVFERGSAEALTTGFWVLTWAQVNTAMNELTFNFERVRAQYRNFTQSRWNAFADSESAAAKVS